MAVNEELTEAVIKSAVMIDGKKKLACAKAFGLAENFGVEKLEIMRICNSNNIRISNCQLGCFK